LGSAATPLREAFFQLISEGFVEAEPRRGVVSATSPETDAEETYVLKGALEALGAGSQWRGLARNSHATEDLHRKINESFNARRPTSVDPRVE